MRSLLWRILRVRCPACGEGHIFRSYFVRAETCGECGRLFERERGYWIGGAEVHMFASYGLSVLLFIPVLVLAGSVLWVQLASIGGHVLLSLLLFRYSRAIFLGVDYQMESAAPEEPGPDDLEGGARTAPRGPSPRSVRAGRRLRRRRVGLRAAQKRATTTVTSSRGSWPDA